MADLLKIKDVHSSIRYIDDGQIPKSNLQEEEIIISRGTKKGDTTTIRTIINYTRMKKLPKTFRLRVVAESRKSGKRQIRKRDYPYDETFTLNKAVQDAEKKRLLLLQEAEAVVELPEEIIEIPTFEDALTQQLKHRENDYKANNRPHDDKNIRQFAEKWLQPISKKKLDKITKADLTAIMAHMNKPDGTPLALRTKRTVYQIVNPVYTWVNDETDFKIDSPAHIKKLKKPDNERGCPFEVEEGDIEKLKLLFRKLYYYALDRTGNRTHNQLRGVYIWLMHGRRLNEVLSLKWEHIDLEKKTYKITKENNKARKDMEYILTGYQLEAIGRPKKRGWVFPSINDAKKALSKETIRNHDIGLFEEGMHKHDLRHCIGGYLINNGTLKEVISVILGHTQNKSITDRYAQVRKQTANKAILSMLDDLLGLQLSIEEIKEEKKGANNG